jgi:predicted ATPase
LADAGTGVAQELPILVQRVLDVLEHPSSSTLEIIEQPELHLHPAAHAALADLYLEAARNTGVRFLIETHSEALLLRLRRRIAEGSHSPESVAIYFVDQRDGASTVRRVRIDSSGQLDYWPEGVFSEDYEEARALASAQLAKGKLLESQT